jgi:hypothetical protein
MQTMRKGKVSHYGEMYCGLQDGTAKDRLLNLDHTFRSAGLDLIHARHHFAGKIEE